jgi:hypothetical protein
LFQTSPPSAELIPRRFSDSPARAYVVLILFCYSPEVCSIGPTVNRRGIVDATMSDVYLVLRYTRRWIQYGIFAHTALCAIVAAIEGVMGR